MEENKTTNKSNATGCNRKALLERLTAPATKGNTASEEDNHLNFIDRAGVELNEHYKANTDFLCDVLEELTMPSHRKFIEMLPEVIYNLTKRNPTVAEKFSTHLTSVLLTLNEISDNRGDLMGLREFLFDVNKLHQAKFAALVDPESAK